MRAAYFSFFIFAQASAAEFSANLSVPHAEISLFDPVSLQLTLNYPKGYNVDPIYLQNHLLQVGGYGIAPFQIGRVLRDQKEKNGEVIDTFTFVLNPQSFGKKTLSFWKIPLIPPEGEKETYLYPNWVEVEIAEPDEKINKIPPAPFLEVTEAFPIDLNDTSRILLADLSEQEPSRNQRIFQQRTFAWLGWLLLALGGWFLWKFRTPRSKDEREREKQAARNQLKSSLNELQKAIQSGNLEDFYTLLATHLRLFYEQFYGQRINALTTEEFLKQASPAMRETLQEILVIGDQVRFGHLPGNRENAQKALDIALKQLTFYG